jgi:hypothetical protein
MSATVTITDGNMHGYVEPPYIDVIIDVDGDPPGPMFISATLTKWDEQVAQGGPYEHSQTGPYRLYLQMTSDAELHDADYIWYVWASFDNATLAGDLTINTSMRHPGGWP